MNVTIKVHGFLHQTQPGWHGQWTAINACNRVWTQSGVTYITTHYYLLISAIIHLMFDCSSSPFCCLVAAANEDSLPNNNSSSISLQTRGNTLFKYIREYKCFLFASSQSCKCSLFCWKREKKCTTIQRKRIDREGERGAHVCLLFKFKLRLWTVCTMTEKGRAELLLEEQNYLSTTATQEKAVAGL